jgi:hypothetical protein
MLGCGRGRFHFCQFALGESDPSADLSKRHLLWEIGRADDAVEEGGLRFANSRPLHIHGCPTQITEDGPAHHARPFQQISRGILENFKMEPLR